MAQAGDHGGAADHVPRTLEETGQERCVSNGGQRTKAYTWEASVPRPFFAAGTGESAAGAAFDMMLLSAALPVAAREIARTIC